MRYYVIKNGITTHCVAWDGVSSWQCPYEYDLILYETDWSEEQYPFPPKPEPVIEPDPVINLNDFSAVFGDFCKGKEFASYSDMLRAFNDYVAGLEG